jgi:hypothetical protein
VTRSAPTNRSAPPMRLLFVTSIFVVLSGCRTVRPLATVPSEREVSAKRFVVVSVQVCDAAFEGALRLLRDQGIALIIVSTLGGGYASVSSADYERALGLLESDPSLAHVVHPRHLRADSSHANPPPSGAAR